MEKRGPSYRAMCGIGSHGLNRSSWVGGQEEERGLHAERHGVCVGNPAWNKEVVSCIWCRNLEHGYIVWGVMYFQRRST